jgi:hypothetical protein
MLMVRARCGAVTTKDDCSLGQRIHVPGRSHTVIRITGLGRGTPMKSFMANAPLFQCASSQPALWLLANPAGCYRPHHSRVHQGISVEASAQSLARPQQPHIGAPYRYADLPIRAAEQGDLRFRRDQARSAAAH